MYPGNPTIVALNIDVNVFHYHKIVHIRFFLNSVDFEFDVGNLLVVNVDSVSVAPTQSSIKRTFPQASSTTFPENNHGPVRPIKSRSSPQIEGQLSEVQRSLKHHTIVVGPVSATDFLDHRQSGSLKNYRQNKFHSIMLLEPTERLRSGTVGSRNGGKRSDQRNPSG